MQRRPPRSTRFPYATLVRSALGWAGYGLFLVFVVIAGRAKVTVTQLPAALAGLVINVVLLVLLVDPLGIAGAGIALGASYVAMMVVLGLLTRRSFHVPFEWRRLAHAVVVLAGITVAGELLLPTDGVAGFVSRALALGIIPVVLAISSFATPQERAMLRAFTGVGLGRVRTAFRR